MFNSGQAITGLAHLAWYGVPLSGDWRADECGFTEGSDRAERLRALCTAYGRWESTEVLAEAVVMIRTERVQMAELAHRELAPWTRFVADGALTSFDAEADWIENHALRLAPSA